ncbi:MAG: hypothetical protein CME32_17000 [Gimesia sp.]|nr:hypothetical protein [Gimesia sp.]
MGEDRVYFLGYENEQNREIRDGLRKLMISGCTLTELIHFVESRLGNDIDHRIIKRYLSDAFDVFVRNFKNTDKMKHPLELSILTSAFITQIVANRDEWQPVNDRQDCWMDHIYSQPPLDVEDSIPFSLSKEGWESLSATDQEALHLARRNSEDTGYRSVVLSVLCEQLQFQLRELKSQDSL